MPQIFDPALGYNEMPLGWLMGRRKAIRARLKAKISKRPKLFASVSETEPFSAGDPASIEAQYQRLRRLPKKELYAEFRRSHRVSSPEGEPRMSLISQMLHSAHGEKRVQAWAEARKNFAASSIPLQRTWQDHHAAARAAEAAGNIEMANMHRVRAATLLQNRTAGVKVAAPRPPKQINRQAGIDAAKRYLGKDTKLSSYDTLRPRTHLDRPQPFAASDPNKAHADAKYKYWADLAEKASDEAYGPNQSTGLHRKAAETHRLAHYYAPADKKKYHQSRRAEHMQKAAGDYKFSTEPGRDPSKQFDPGKKTRAQKLQALQARRQPKDFASYPSLFHYVLDDARCKHLSRYACSLGNKAKLGEVSHEAAQRAHDQASVAHDVRASALAEERGEEHPEVQRHRQLAELHMGHSDWHGAKLGNKNFASDGDGDPCTFCKAPHGVKLVATPGGPKLKCSECGMSPQTRELPPVALALPGAFASDLDPDYKIASAGAYRATELAKDRDTHKRAHKLHVRAATLASAAGDKELASKHLAAVVEHEKQFSSMGPVSKASLAPVKVDKPLDTSPTSGTASKKAFATSAGVTSADAVPAASPAVAASPSDVSRRAASYEKHAKHYEKLLGKDDPMVKKLWALAKGS